MSLHRTKATIIGLLEGSRVNEWIVTEKLGDFLKHKVGTKAPRKLRFRIGERYTLPPYEIKTRLYVHSICFFFLTIFSIVPNLGFAFFCLNVDRLHMLELAVGCYLFFCGCYDVVFGKNHFFLFLYIQAFAFFIMGFGYVGTFVPNS